MKEYIKAPLKSQNEIFEANVNWKSKREITSYIKLREEEMQKFIKIHLLGISDKE